MTWPRGSSPTDTNPSAAAWLGYQAAAHLAQSAMERLRGQQRLVEEAFQALQHAQQRWQIARESWAAAIDT